MTWATEASAEIRETFELIETDFDYVTSVTTPTNSDGSLCYNTPATCSQAGITIGIKTRRWSTHNKQAIRGLPSRACLADVQRDEDQLQIGDGLSRFGKLTAVLYDFPDDDRGEDPHVDDSSRTYEATGDYFRRMIARNPYTVGRALRYKSGFLGSGSYNADNFRTWHYLVRAFTGPTRSQRPTVLIEGVSPLQLLNLNQVQVPEPSPGRLLSGISAGAGSATITPASAADSYGASGKLRINDEIISYTRSGVTLTFTDRGQEGTDAAQHAADDTIQDCAVYTAADIDDVLYDLLVTRGPIDAALIPTADWQTENDDWMSLWSITKTLSKPKKIIDRINDLLVITASFMWWDAERNELRWRAVRPQLGDNAPVWTEKEILGDGVETTQEIGERVSRTDVLLGVRTPVADETNDAEYRVTVRGESFGVGANEHDGERARVVRTEWLSADQYPLAARASTTISQSLQDGRIRYRVVVPPREATPDLGDVVKLNHRHVTGTSGHAELANTIVVKRRELSAGSSWEYLLERFPFTGRFAYLSPTGLPTYVSASDAQRDPAFFLCGADGLMPNGDPPYVLG